MSRYFIEVAYKGTNYSGFQVQQNGVTIQSEVEKAFATIHRRHVAFTGSSRTDAGVHALQNYFHFDFEAPLHQDVVYKMNAILPDDVVVKRFVHMHVDAHSRFDAISREYIYKIYRHKNPFLKGIANYYPFKLDMQLMHEAAAVIKEQTNFFAFSKTNTQVKNFNCKISISQWMVQEDVLVYNIEGNRFLRGMVRLLTASMLKVGRGHLSTYAFKEFFQSVNVKCGFSVPPDGLFLKQVNYPKHYFS